jgi:Ca-activated chloride channel family protein
MKTQMRFGVWMLLGLFGAGLWPCQGVGFIVVSDPPEWSPPVRPVPPRARSPRFYRFAPLEVESVKVHARIQDQIAATTVEQEFYNPNPTRLEGTFVFPVPKGAHLDKFSMEIDGKPVEAELLNADKARGIYEDIVRRIKDPALLEYEGRDAFKVRIFPIEPNSRKRISVSYGELLPADEGLIGYTLPLNTEKFSCAPIKSVSVQVEVETKRPLKSIYSPSHTVEIKRLGPSSATAGFEESETRPENDFALYFAAEKDELGVNLLTHKTDGEDGYFLLLASPGAEVSAKQVLPKDVAFVLDTSGSMAGPKLSQAKKALQFCVENLNDQDRFELIRFSTEVEPLFDKLVPASQANRDRAEDFIQDLRATGATDIDDALHKALEMRKERQRTARDSESRKNEDPSPLKVAHGRASGGDQEDSAAGAPDRAGDRPFVVIFLTDGMPTIGTTDEEQIVANARQASAGRARVFCFGIGTDVNTHLLDRIAEVTRAFSQYVLPEEDLEVKLSSFFSKIKEPVVADPALKFSGPVRVSKLYPSPLPDLFKGEQLVLAGRYTGEGNAAVVVEGTVNGNARKFAYEVKFPEENAGNEFLPRLWATRRVGVLLDEIRLHGENDELRDEVTELARRYGIVTPYTAFLIAEDEDRRNLPQATHFFRSLEGDSGARREAAKAWSDFKNNRDGSSAVGGSRYTTTLKMADAPAPAAAASAEDSLLALGQPAGNRPLATPMLSPAESSRERFVQYSQQTTFAGGKNFFRSNQQWIDGEVQKYPQARHVRVRFGSSEYFELVAHHAEASPWLALGQNVQFVLEGTIYEVYGE